MPCSGGSGPGPRRRSERHSPSRGHHRPATIRTVECWPLDEPGIAKTAVGPLADLHHRREQQRQDPAFGELLGKDRVYLRLPDPEEPAAWWLTEHDLAGRRLRQIELRPDGATETSGTADWPMNPPLDLGDPQFASHEISQDEFERAWKRATRNE